MPVIDSHRPSPEKIRRLGEHDRSAVTAHFVALAGDDRRLRFGSTLSTEAIVDYVEGIDFARDAMLGLHDDNGGLIGAAHVALGDAEAELGISVLPGYRRRGVGSALFSRAVAHVRDRKVSKVFMHCLAENTAMMHIARRCGMEIVVAAGGADAHLVLSPANASPAVPSAPLTLASDAAPAMPVTRHPVPMSPPPWSGGGRGASGKLPPTP